MHYIIQINSIFSLILPEINDSSILFKSIESNILATIVDSSPYFFDTLYF